MDQNLTQYVDTLFTHMKTFTQEDGLIGKPVVQGDKTFLPVISITFGYGGGDSTSKANQDTASLMGKKNNMMGDAIGVGAKICTDAILVIDKDNVSIAPISQKTGSVSQIIDKIPQILSKAQTAQQSGQQPQG